MITILYRPSEYALFNSERGRLCFPPRMPIASIVLDKNYFREMIHKTSDKDDPIIKDCKVIYAWKTLKKKKFCETFCNEIMYA